MTKMWIVRTSYDCADEYFSTKKKAIKFIIDDNIEQPGRTSDKAYEVTLR